MEAHEAVVIGGGPAGSAAAILLARRGHEVALVRPATPPDAGLAESVPPSARKLLAELGLLEAIDGAGFHPNRGNTVWWAGGEARSESFVGGEAGAASLAGGEARSEPLGGGGGTGFHTDRLRLERVLATAAESMGVRLVEGLVRDAIETPEGWTLRCETGSGATRELRTSWVLDATGRHGMVARREGRVPDRGTTTLALLQRWRLPALGGRERVGHTLIESFPDGWAWSIPLDDRIRCVAVMVDQRRTELAGSDVSAMLAAALGGTHHLAASLEGATPDAEAWACPASLYTSTRFARRSLLLVGDAGSAIDPLSSYGVKKALSAGWLAGVAAHTALVDPGMADLAVAHFDERERLSYRASRQASVAFFEEAAGVYGTPFWMERAESARAAAGVAGTDGDDRSGARADTGPIHLDMTIEAVPPERVRAAFDELRGRERMEAVPGPTLSRRDRSAVVGQRIVLAEHLVSAACPDGLRWVRGVDLTRLVDVAQRHVDVPESWSAYNDVAAPVTLPDYLTALSTAFAAGFLVHRPD